MKFDLILFDCDGTLVDTEYLQNLSCAQLMAEEGLPQYDVDTIFRRFVGVRFNRMLEEISAETGHVFPPGMGPRYVERVKKLSPTHFKRIGGVAEFIAAARRQAKICVASNGQRDNVIHSLGLADLKKYFPDEHIFTAVQVENPKPAPDLYLFAAEKMEVDPSRCIVLEDSVPGVTAGVAAGMYVWGFIGTHHDKNSSTTALKKAGAHEIFDTFIHMRQVLFP